MSPAHLTELNSETRARVLEQFSGTESTTACRRAGIDANLNGGNTMSTKVKTTMLQQLTALNQEITEMAQHRLEMTREQRAAFRKVLVQYGMLIDILTAKIAARRPKSTS